MKAMIKKSETKSKREPFFMFLGLKLRNGRQIQNEGLFFQDHQIFATEIKFVDPSGSLSYLGLKSGPRYEKV